MPELWVRVLPLRPSALVARGSPGAELDHQRWWRGMSVCRRACRRRGGKRAVWRFAGRARRGLVAWCGCGCGGVSRRVSRRERSAAKWIYKEKRAKWIVVSRRVSWRLA